MTREEFRTTIAPKLMLLKVKNEELQTWYEILVKYPVKEIYDAILLYFECDRNQYKPKAYDILKYRLKKEKEVRTITKCETCHGRGIVQAIIFDERTQTWCEVFYKCVCDNGRYYKKFGRMPNYFACEDDKYFISEKAYDSYKAYEKEIRNRGIQNEFFKKFER